MIEVQTIGRKSWPKRVRAWLNDLFGSAYVAHLERELLQAKLERDRVIADLRAENRDLLNRLLAANRIAPIITPKLDSNKKPAAITSNWEQLRAQAIADNAKAEADEAKTAAQEN